MPKSSKPSTPIEAYKAIIDQLVEETSIGYHERMLREHGVYTKVPNRDAENDFVSSLETQQRDLFTRMLREERNGAIHDVLALLTWWLECREVGLTFRGHPMPFGLNETGLHGDYVARCDEMEWPDDDDEMA